MKITDTQILLSEIMSIESCSLIKIPVLQKHLETFHLIAMCHLY